MAVTSDPCPEDQLAKLAELAAGDTRKGLRRAEVLLGTYASDPRLHFLRGSLMAALQRFDEAAAPMRRAVEIAPSYHIARFQLGLLLLSSGDPEAAAEAWGPLGALDPADPLRLFAEGLQQMIRDDFGEAERRIREGIARNTAHPALNRDMQMMLERMAEVAGRPHGEESSPAHWLLQVSASRTKH
jgi:Flp pilus assembly protein TadD